MPRPARTTKKVKKEPEAAKDPTTIKRERSLRACTRCRQRKQRCDNALPDCGNCIKGGVPCEAIPIEVVSRDNLVQLYDQLQESTRQNAAMQQELDLARIMAPDTLCVFSAVIAQQVTGQGYSGDGSRCSAQARFVGIVRRFKSSTFSTSILTSSISVAMVQLYMPSTISAAKEDATTDRQTASISKQLKPQRTEAKLELWKVVEVLGMCFPAVAPAVSFAVEQIDPKADSGRWCTLADLAAVPTRELLTVLGGTTTPSTSQSQPHETAASIKELIGKILTASEMTRVAATLLWALLALANHRTEELLRMTTVLTCFMQAWQTQASSDASMVVGVVPIAFRRAYDWVRLQTAIITGKLHIHATSALNSFEGIESIACKNDFSTFLASLSVEQKRLEYLALHIFTSPSDALTDTGHDEAVWQLLRSIKELSDVFSQTSERFSVSLSTAVNSKHALMRQKMGVQLYGMFPRLLFIYCPNDRRHWRWLANAAPLAVTALGYHGAAWGASRWTGDCVGDAVGFADLLAAFVWTLQQRQAHNDLREDFTEAVQMAIGLGEQYSMRWPQCASIINPALDELRAFPYHHHHHQQESLPPPPISTSTSWPPILTSSTTSSSSAHQPSSPDHLRTPHACEPPLNPYITATNLLELQDLHPFRVWPGQVGGEEQQQQQSHCSSALAGIEEDHVYASATFGRDGGGGGQGGTGELYNCETGFGVGGVEQGFAGQRIAVQTGAARTTQQGRMLLYMEDA
ncbi:uncharacterized protein UTRI_05986 [Ustilago trichophora]|uniref:Zn(2)-C6 fungal-type domain-containing protein n=1 Tax=Ustilago trichophora TaxID=86804 RepID=A0A5C3EK98_9BASI|nr:uncharacterized protein UTRI_05986 [Ustilago trichophora]